MKVRNRTSSRPALVHAGLVLSLSLCLLMSVFVGSAAAIDRAGVLKRANVWVKKRIPYSQRNYYKGYRRDCSGFVSMAWNLKTSYSTRTIGSRANRISISALKPGDAVLVRGRHVSIFGRWVNKRARRYVALEQTTWGSHAKRRVRTIPRRAIAIRRKGIQERRRVLVVARPAPKPVPKPVVTAAPKPAIAPVTASVAAASTSQVASPSTVAASAIATQPSPLLLDLAGLQP